MGVLLDVLVHPLAHEYLIHVVGPLDVIGVLDGELHGYPAFDLMQELAVDTVVVILHPVVLPELDDSLQIVEVVLDIGSETGDERGGYLRQTTHVFDQSLL